MDESKYETYKREREARKQKNAEERKKAVWVVLAVAILAVAFGVYKFIIPTTSTAAPAVKAVTTTAEKVAEKPKAVPAALSGKVRETPAPHDYSILVKKSEFKLYLLDHGEKVAVWPVALGKNPGQKTVSGDKKTPTGTFTVDEIDNAKSWTHDFHDGKGVIKNAYGPWFISLDTKNLSKGKWDGIGIHGTHKPEAIGTRDSEGCVRLENSNLEILKPYVKVGTKVTIEE